MTRGWPTGRGCHISGGSGVLSGVIVLRVLMILIGVSLVGGGMPASGGRCSTRTTSLSAA